MMVLRRRKKVTPLSLVGNKLTVDLDSDHVQLGAGSRVSAWTDQSDRGNTVAQGTFANQPTRVLNDLDGHGAVNFVTASNQFMSRELGTFTGLAAGDKPRFYVAMTWAANNLNRCAVELSDTNGFNRGWQLAAASDASLNNGWQIGPVGSSSCSLTPAPLTPKLYDSRLIADRPRLSVNNGQSFVDGNLVIAGGFRNTLTKLVIGRLADNVNYSLSGKIYRFLIVNPEPTSAEHDALIAFFKSTYPSLGLP